MTSAASRDDFAVLLRRAGIDAPEAEIDDLFTGWSHIEPMLDRIRGAGTRGRDAEPALIFRPDAFADGASPEDAPLEDVPPEDVLAVGALPRNASPEGAP